MQPQITQLILSNSPELPTLRSRTISGNKQYLHYFCTSVNQLLQNPVTHPHAYREINQLLLSARTDIMQAVAKEVLPEVCRMHRTQTGDLDQYVRLWRRLTVDDQRYPDLAQGLKTIKVVEDKKPLPQQFENFHRRFKKNLNQLQQNRIQFFQDSSSNSNPQSSPSPSPFPISLTEQQASSQIIQSQLKQLNAIRTTLQQQNQRTTKENALQYYNTARHFLSLKPKSLTKQLSYDFNSSRIWAREFVQNYGNLKKSDSLTVQRFGGSKTDLGVSDRVIEEMERKNVHGGFSNTYTYNKGNYGKNNWDSSGSGSAMESPSFKKGSIYQYSKPFSFEKPRDEEESKRNQKKSVSPKHNFGYNAPNRYTFQPQSQPQPQSSPQPHQQISSNKQPLPQSYTQPIPQLQPQSHLKPQPQQQVGTPTQFIPQISYQNYNLQIQSKNQQPSPQSHQQSPFAYSMQTYQSQTVPYDYTNFHPRHTSPLPQLQPQLQPQLPPQLPPQSVDPAMRTLISSQSSRNFYGSVSPRPRPKIFGRTSQNNYEEPPQQKLDVFVYGRDNKKQNNSYYGTASQRIPNIRGTRGTNNNMNSGDQFQYRSDGFVEIPYQPNSPRMTFLSDRTPYSSSEQNQQVFPYNPNMRSPWAQDIIPKDPGSNNFRSSQSGHTTKDKTPKKPKLLSEYAIQKQQRKNKLITQQFRNLQNYISEPYTRNFVHDSQFIQFKINCLQDHNILYENGDGDGNGGLIIQCMVSRVSDIGAKVQVLFRNDSGVDMDIYTLYRIPRCMKYEKQGRIHRNWILKERAKHTFILNLVSFPLQPCFMNLKYGPKAQVPNFDYISPIELILPITLRSYLQFLVINEAEFHQKYNSWKSQNNFHLTRNLLLDKKALNNEPQLSAILPSFLPLQPSPKFSVQQLGAHLYHKNYSNLQYLLKISVRAHNIGTVELLTDRKIEDEDQADYLVYCVDMWSLLLGRVSGYVNDDVMGNM